MIVKTTNLQEAPLSASANTAEASLRARAAAVLPNGMYGHQSIRLLPLEYPQFFSRAQGAHIWDADGNRYIDYMCAYGPNLLGYADPEIDAAYIEQLRRGDTMTGPAPLIVDLAEAFTGQVQHADWALFCKNGTDATTAAMMAARAATGRSTILRARGAYHGSAPWCTPLPAGTTAGERANQIFYDYNDLASLRAAAAEAGDGLAAIFASPFKHDAFVTQALPDKDYAAGARALCDAAGALLIVDEVRVGFRLSRDCYWEQLGVSPDLSSWGKVVANGHPISALLGNTRARPGVEGIYVTGSFWFSAAPMAAALATLRRVRDSDYVETIARVAGLLRDGLSDLARRHSVGFSQSGPAAMPLFLFADDPDFRASFFWCTEMLKRGAYVHPWHNMFINAAMTEDDVAATLQAADGAFDALNHARATLPPNERLAPLFAAMEH
jgi:glutamate-1-semialdehyde 2,1-aminomutase